MSKKVFQSFLRKSAIIQKMIEQEQKYRPNNWMRLLKLKTIRLSLQQRMQRLVQKSKLYKALNFKQYKLSTLT